MFVQKFKKVFEFVYFSIVIILAAGAYIACDIGLGGAVDTEPPTGGISSPGDNAVIRDAFAIKGSWKDDGAVGKVTVALRNTSTNSTNTYNATVAPDGTWLCAVNPADSSQPLADGNYVATVTLYDNGGHTGKLTRSYTVDNTPPVVILSYLKSKDDSATEIKTYGKLFTLSGKAADDNNINRIDVKVYQDEECSTELRTITKLNVPAAIEQDVASFGTEEYSAIYGQNSTNSQVRYCKVFAYDDAQRYPADGSAQTDSDKLGNCQTSYYFQTTIEKLGYDKYKTNDLYAMFNGTYSNPTQDSSRAALSTDEIAAVKKALTDTAVKVGTFALNPENSPTYRVIGLNKVLAKSESMEKEGTSLYPINEAVSSYILTNGTSDTGTPLTINVTPGRDNYAIETSTVVAYFQECDKYGNVIIKDNNGNGKYVVKDKDGNIKKDSSGNYIDENGNSISYVEPLKEAEKIIIGTGSSSITSNAVSTLTYTGLETSHCYRVFVDGKDTQGNQILPAFDVNGNSQIYAFYLDPLNGVIELSISGKPWGQNASNFEPVTNYISSDTTNEDYKQFKVLLNYSYTGDQRLDVYRKENDGSFTVINDSELAKGTDNTYPILIDAASLTSDVLTFTYKLENTDKTSYSRERSITVYRDNTLPEVTSLVIPATRDTSNTFFQFSGTAKDPLSASNITGSGIAEVWVTLYQTKIENGQEVEDTAKSVTVKATGTESWYLQINKNNTEDYSKYQTLLAEEGKKKIKVKVIDKVGLEKETTPKDWTYKPTKPIFEIKSYTPEGGSEINLNNSYSFNTGKRFILNGTASDNYGIEDIKVVQTKTNNSIAPQTLSIKNSKITYNADTKEWSISDLPIIPEGTTAKDAIGKYEYKFTVTDKAEIDTDESDILKIVYDNEKPVISNVKADVDINKDSDNTKKSENEIKWYKNLTQYIKVSASDGDGSGIASVEWCTLKDGVEPDASTEWQPLTIKTELAGENFITTYNGSVVFTDDAAGNKLYIRATDNVGNVTKFTTKKTANSVTSDIDYIVFNIDTSVPVLKAAYYEIEGISGLKNPAGTIYLDGSKKITVYGQYSDVHSGVKDLELSLGNTTFTKYYSEKDLTYNTDEQGNNISVKNPAADWATSIANADKIKSWKVEFTPSSIETNKTFDFNVTGENNAGGKTEIKPVFSVIKDTEAPTIVRKNVTFTYSNTETNDDVVYMKGEKGKTGEKYYVNNTRDKFTLKGIATDNIALDSIELKAKDKDGNYVTISSTKSGSASTWTFSDIVLSSLSEKATLCVEVTDLAGNKNSDDNQKIELIFDTKAPEGKHLVDGKGKDIYFRIGNGKNDDNANVTTDGDKYNPLLDDDAGSKYSAGSYANTTNLEIRGLFDDGDILKTDGSTYADNEKPDVSGLKTIYYKVYTKEEYEADLNRFGNLSGKTDEVKKSINDKLAKEVKTSPTGTISPLSTAKEKRVFYTDIAITSAGSTLGGKLTSQGYITDKDGNKKHWAKILSNFNEKLTNFNEQNNYLVLVAEDNVGNFAVDVAEIDSNTLYNNFSLNVDTQAPVTANFTCSAAYTNASDSADGKLRNGNIILTGTVADYLKGGSTLSTNVSELKSLTIKVGNTDNKIEFKIKEEENVTNYYVDNVKQTSVPTAVADISSYPNILTTNKVSDASDAALAIRQWKATIPGTYFAGLSGNVVISVIAKDNAGNEKEETAANVIVDSVAPAVNLNLAENTTVNGKQTLKGTISDSYLTEDPAGASEPGTLELFYTIKDGTTTAPASIDSTAAATANAATDWRKYGTVKHGSSFEFKDIDTAKLILSGGTDSTTYIPDQTKVYFTVKATDKAGNIGFSTPKSFTVDQDTDRPVITIKNLPLESMTSAGVWAKNNQLFGTATDDDGVSAVYVMRKNADDEEPSASDDGWGNNLLEGGIWQYSIPKDGHGVFYFRVVDSQTPANTYISSATNSLQSTPKIYDNKSTPNQYGIRGETTDSRVYLKVDTTKPEIRNVFYRLSDSTTEITAITPSADELSEMLTNSTKPAGWEILTPAGLDYIGGTSSSSRLWILYDFWDDNGVKEIETEQIKREGQSVDGVSSATFTPTENSDPAYRLIKFDLSTLNSGDNKLTLKVKDQADSSSEPKEYTIKIDNTAPGVDIRNPQEESDEYGSLAVSASGSVSDEHINNRDINNISGLYFAITKDETKPDVTSTDWTNIKDCVTVTGRWNILFDKDDDTGLGLAGDDFYHAKKLNEYLKVLYPSEFTGTEDIHKDLYFWVYAVDSLGNSDYSSAQKVKIAVYTQADKPDLTIEYPDSSATTLAGMIRISGSAEIRAEKVASVWLKIDPEYNGTSFNDSGWETKLTALNSAYTVEDSGNSEIGRAVKADGTTSWHYTINSRDEFGKINGENRKVYIKAYALSSTGKASELKTVNFTINPDKPQIKSAGNSDENVLILVNKADPTKKMQYEENMWISGEWYLEGSVRHGAGISLFTYTEAGKEGIDLIDTVTLENTGLGNITLTARTDAMDAGAKAKNWDFKIPVGASGDDKAGTNEFTIKILDNSSTKAKEEKTIKVRYDNSAPNSFIAKTSNGVISSTNKDFRNSNGQFALSGTIKENESAGESGVKRIAFYFTREAKATPTSTTKTTYFIDPMINKVSSTTTEPDKYRNNYVDVSSTGISYSDPENGGDGLYWCETDISSVSDKNITLSSLPAAFVQNVRKGGLCKINNVVYTIKAKSGLTITLDSAPASAEKAYFALAQVIDNTSIETGTTNLFTETDTLVNQDGDCMQEGLTGTGGNYEWQATINSTNLYDGPVTLHFVYYDKAGNYKAETFAGMICNNAPRIASVAVKSDYDGNTKFEDTANEISRYYPAGKNSANKALKAVDGSAGPIIVNNKTDGSAFMTLKDMSAIDVEMVGGNGKLHYQYAIGDTAGANGIKHGNVENWKDGSEDNYDENSDYVATTHTHTIDLPVSFFTDESKPVPNNTSAKPVTWFQYKIWDDTDGTEKFVDSQNVTIQIPLDIQVTDVTPPNVVIDPFLWKSATENSLYQNSSKNGHIELEDDWKNASGYSSTATDGEYDSDPKVSGKFVLKGYVYDNKRLKDIQITIPKSTVLTSATTVAVYDNQNKTWKDSDTEGEVTELTKGTMESNGWHFTVSDKTDDGAYFNDKGHKVMWTFEYDTEKISNIAASDVTITVSANDKEGISSESAQNTNTSTGTTDATKHKPAYRMDVVPYISEVTTSLSTLKNNNPSVYARTAQGHYPVKSDETVTISGFNLGTNTSLNISSLSTSGAYEITVNGIKSLNNLNNNNGKGSYNKTVDLATNPTGVYSTYANYYNRQPNNDNNNLLTDDIYFDVWQFKDAGISQSSGYITEPIMKVNPKNGMLNFGFNSGPANYCMANGQETSYTTWVGNYARFSTCGFAVDENGNTHGITVGLDTNPSSGSTGRMTYMTSAWGVSELNSNGNYHGKNSSRFDNIGAPGGTYNETSYSSWVFLEDRFSSPSIVTAVHGNDTYVLLAYYDDLNSEIRFRYGNLSDRNRNKGTKTGERGISFGGFVDQNQYKIPNGNGSLTDNNFGDEAGSNSVNHHAFDSNKRSDAFSVIALSSKKNSSVSSGNYVSIDVIKGSSTSEDVIVATWYDATNNKWFFSYKKNPYNDNDMDTNPSDTPADGNWRKPIELKANAGESCQIAVDKVGGIHIASYDGSGANLVYAYLSSYADKSPQVVTVDAYAFTGTNIRLDTVVSDDGNYIVPYIGYYMSSAQKTKMAYLPSVISSSTSVTTREAVTLPSGVDDSEAFTSSWESTIIPSSSRYADNYAYSYVNIGLYKDASGKAQIMTGTDSAYTNTNGIDASNTSKVYGNGTKNPVVAYATRIGTRGHLETAQMR